jgi:hypothetical protein
MREEFGFLLRNPHSLPTGPGPDRGRGRQAKSELEFSLCLCLPESTCLEIHNTTVDRGASIPDILFDKIYI